MDYQDFLFEPFLEAKIITALKADGLTQVFGSEDVDDRLTGDFSVVSVMVNSALDDGFLATVDGPEYAVYDATATIVHVVERVDDMDAIYERIARTRYTFALTRKNTRFPEVTNDLCKIVRYALPGSTTISPPGQNEVKDRAVQTFGFKFALRPEAIA
jgi:hypothetical protein